MARQTIEHLKAVNEELTNQVQDLLECLALFSDMDTIFRVTNEAIHRRETRQAYTKVIVKVEGRHVSS